MIPSSVNLIPEAPVTDVVALARVAEECGYQGCWVYDEGLATREVYVTMTAVVGATSALRIGPGITNPYTRHPAQTAGAIATLDELSGGRAFYGIGAGGSLTLDPMGIERTRPLAAVREAIETGRRLFAELDYGRPDIPIWLAGRGPKMLQLGGAVADGVMLDFIHKEALGDYVDLVRKGAETTGNEPRICYSTVIGGLDAVRPHMTYRLVDSPAAIKEKLGLTEADSDRIRTAMGSGLAAAAEHVRDEWVEPFIAADGDELRSLMSAHDIDEFLLPVFDVHDEGAAIRATAAML